MGEEASPEAKGYSSGEWAKFIKLLPTTRQGWQRQNNSIIIEEGTGAI